MPVDNLAQTINSLSAEHQELVREFVEFLKKEDTPPSSPFLAAANEFIQRHPELLQRLAQ